MPGLSEADADQLADALGDLPLAIAQAAGFMAETGMAAGDYLGLLRTRAGQLLAQGAAGVLPAVAGGRHPADRGPARR